MSPRVNSGQTAPGSDHLFHGVNGYLRHQYLTAVARQQREQVIEVVNVRPHAGHARAFGHLRLRRRGVGRAAEIGFLNAGGAKDVLVHRVDLVEIVVDAGAGVGLQQLLHVLIGLQRVQLDNVIGLALRQLG